jgi:stage III sporulation protein AG
LEEGKKKIFAWKKLKKENYVVIFLVGILLLVAAWPVEKQNETDLWDTSDATMDMKEDETSDSLLQMTEEETASDDYTGELAKELEELLSTMEGAGQVKVMITLKASSEKVIEKEKSSSQSSSTEVDSQGGSRNTADISSSEETVYTEDGSVQSPFVKQIIYPEIEGVVVSAQGGGNASVNKNITEAIQALFGIEAHKIKIIKMSSG